MTNTINSELIKVYKNTIEIIKDCQNFDDVKVAMKMTSSPC